MWKVAGWSWESQSSNSAFCPEVTYITSAYYSLIRTKYLALAKHKGPGSAIMARTQKRESRNI